MPRMTATEAVDYVRKIEELKQELNRAGAPENVTLPLHGAKLEMEAVAKDLAYKQIRDQPRTR